MIDGFQVRMARAAMRWGVRDLAEKASVSPNTITRVEADNPANAATLGAIQRALESAGIIFVAADDAAGAGVRMGKVKGRKR